MNDDELSISEASAALNVSHTAVQNMIKDGRLTVVRDLQYGSKQRVLVSRESVEAEGQRRKGKPRGSIQ